MQTATMPLAGPREFHNLTLRVRAAGLLDRRLGYYWVKMTLTVGAFAAAGGSAGGGWISEEFAPAPGGECCGVQGGCRLQG